MATSRAFLKYPGARPAEGDAMSGAAKRIRARLLKLRDEEYRAFSASLMPTVPPERVIGVRAPALRSLARELRGTPDAAEFLADLPHGWYEEDNLHAYLIGDIADPAACAAALEAFLPYVDNWATCDALSPKALTQNPEDLERRVRAWLDSGRPYVVRFGLDALMKYFLDARFHPRQLEWAAKLRSEEYYVRMAVAWYFATALAKQYAAALKYIEARRLDSWTHNKAIQKALESRRVSEAQKEYLKSLKIPARKLS